MADLHTEARAVRMYAETDMSQADVGKEFSVSQGTVGNWLDNHGVESKSRGRQRGDPRLYDDDWLRERYIGDGASMNELADELDCSSSAVQYALARADISTRASTCENVDPRLHDEGWLRGRYINDEASTHDLAAELNCSQGAVWSALSRAGIVTRPRSAGGPTAGHCDAYGLGYDSKWEHETAHVLEEYLGVSWLAQEEYETDAGLYKADFRLLRRHVVIEVKGRVDYGDGYTQAPKLRELDERVVVVGGNRAREALPHDAFVEYTGDRGKLAERLAGVLGRP